MKITIIGRSLLAQKWEGKIVRLVLHRYGTQLVYRNGRPDPDLLDKEFDIMTVVDEGHVYMRHNIPNGLQYEFEAPAGDKFWDYLVVQK